ncbi:MAG: hypothetical protein ACFFD5_10000 [Candidatus Thorarchaeota archaeon]
MQNIKEKKTLSHCDNGISDCSICPLNSKLNCKFTIKDTILFNITFLAYFIPAILGMILGGFWLWILPYTVYWIFFIQIWENKTLCSHCPHYGNERKTINCYGNYGIYNLWKYNPIPMSISHQIQFIVGIGILLLYPIPFLILGNQFLMLILSIVGILIWISNQLIRMCSHCINLSCPLNRVPKNIASEYLKKNEAMRNAWNYPEK